MERTPRDQLNGHGEPRFAIRDQATGRVIGVLEMPDEMLARFAMDLRAQANQLQLEAGQAMAAYAGCQSMLTVLAFEKHRRENSLKLAMAIPPANA